MKYFRASLRRCLHAGVQLVFDCPFLWEPPLHRLKCFAYQKLLRTHFHGDVLVGQSVRILEPQNLEIGESSYLGCGVRVEARAPVHIGARTTVGPQALITTGDHSLTDLAPTNATVWIGDGVFIGARAMILGGVTIGDNSIVGAGSIVTRDVAPNSVVAGVPARMIRQRVPPTRTWTVFGFEGQRIERL